MLVDTSIWVDHLRAGNERLAAVLAEGAVTSHPFIIGELACGHLTDRAEILGYLHQLPRVLEASHDEAMSLLEERQLGGRGAGWIDVHLLASALLSEEPLWTRDKRLLQLAKEIGVAARV